MKFKNKDQLQRFIHSVTGPSKRSAAGGYALSLLGKPKFFYLSWQWR